jgi:hypothetical protein
MLIEVYKEYGTWQHLPPHYSDLRQRLELVGARYLLGPHQRRCSGVFGREIPGEVAWVIDPVTHEEVKFLVQSVHYGLYKVNGKPIEVPVRLLGTVMEGV